MSVTDQNGWSEVERLARQHEASINQVLVSAGLPLVKIEVADRLRGSIVESLSLLEDGHQTAAYQVLQDALKIREAM